MNYSIKASIKAFLTIFYINCKLFIITVSNILLCICAHKSNFYENYTYKHLENCNFFVILLYYVMYTRIQVTYMGSENLKQSTQTINLNSDLTENNLEHWILL